MNDIPTAKRFLDLETNANLGKTKSHKITNTGYIHISDLPDIMIEFAKLHVKKALEEASEKAEISCGPPCCVSINSILNSYPEDLIK